MQIITVPHQTLRQEAKTVKKFDKKFFKFLKNLGKTLVEKEAPKGVGLAAPQVAKSIRVFAAIVGKDQNVKFFVNPIFRKHSKKTILGLKNGEDRFEGCLSIPKLYGPVPRWEWVEIEYLTPSDKEKDEFGNPKMIKKVEKYEDFDARVLQHEYDHLDGILFTDRIKDANTSLYVEENGEWVEVKNRDEVIDLF
jgi:peptide deformylase